MNARRITRIALSGAILFVSQVIAASLPNIELVSLLTILFTIVFGADAYLIVTVFSVMEVLFYGFGTWVIMYFYTWPILVLITRLCRGLIEKSDLMVPIISGIFGLLFGTFCSLFYVPVDPSFAVTYWIAGLPWDLLHGVANIVIALVLYKPLLKVLRRIEKGVSNV